GQDQLTPAGSDVKSRITYIVPDIEHNRASVAILCLQTRHEGVGRDVSSVWYTNERFDAEQCACEQVELACPTLILPNEL
ncbi:hypothetical protein HaLaN_29297, partial [Haematococcus lacustris]